MALTSLEKQALSRISDLLGSIHFPNVYHACSEVHSLTDEQQRRVNVAGSEAASKERSKIAEAQQWLDSLQGQ